MLQSYSYAYPLRILHTIFIVKSTSQIIIKTLCNLYYLLQTSLKFSLFSLPALVSINSPFIIPCFGSLIMERIEAKAFKSSCMFSEEAMVNAQPLRFREDRLFLSSASASDDFSVDQFFDLDGLSEQTEDEEEEEEEDKTSSSSSSSISHDQIDEGSFSDANVLAIPADDIKELELWSHLMDGTLHDDIFRNPYIIPGPNRVQFQPKTRPVLIDATRFPPPVQTKARTKRPRCITISWFSCSLLKPDYSFSTTGPGLTKNKKTGLKRMKGGDLEGGPAQQMKCTHCQVQKTPQWRTGPLGPKTLCNACGVRFKSGRLFPEYRPACSPTFSSEVHSNSHRKVVEMRKKKISEHTSSNFAPTLLSC